MESFENIYLDVSATPGKCGVATAGLAWKPAAAAASGETFTLDADSVASAQWSRAARGHELKILTRAAVVVQLDGFDAEDLPRLQKAFKVYYNVAVEVREHALRGWNWGAADFGRAELVFNVLNRPAFALPYTEVANTNLAGKNEVSVEFALPGPDDDVTPTSGARTKGRRTAGARDQLTEMRFYIPGTAAKVVREGGTGSASDDEVAEQNAAATFYETLMDKAEIGDVAGETYGTFHEVLHLTPRGRFDVEMYEKSFRMRGKTYDYKVLYESIKKFMLLPKPDEMHTLVCLGLDPPLRQGQTRYPFLVMQFKTAEEIEWDLNMTEEMIEEKYKGKLQAHYLQPQHSIVAQVFRGLAGKKVITPSKDFSSHHQQSGVKCSIKANEGHLFCLDKSFMFVPKPAQYIPFDHISVVVLSRVGGAISASRTFDITITLKGGAGEHQFSNINREEQKPLEEFFERKNLKVRNEMLEDTTTLIAQALNDADMGDSSDDEVAPVGADRGSADEDEESPDEDFQADSDSDVAEEYDSAHESSGDDADGDADADVDAEMPDADSPAEDEDEERPKKKKVKVRAG